MSDFDRALPYILRFEGGYVNDPDDPGGETNKGVTKAVYDAWRTKQGQPIQSVRLITDAEVAQIYKTNYWDAAKCDELAWPINLAHFDLAVNGGVARANKVLAEAGGATAKMSDLLLRRIVFYDKLCVAKPKLAKYYRGWVHRVMTLVEVS